MPCAASWSRFSKNARCKDVVPVFGNPMCKMMLEGITQWPISWLFSSEVHRLWQPEDVVPDRRGYPRLFPIPPWIKAGRGNGSATLAARDGNTTDGSSHQLRGLRGWPQGPGPGHQ